MYIVAILLTKLCCCQRKAISNFSKHVSPSLRSLVGINWINVVRAATTRHRNRAILQGMHNSVKVDLSGAPKCQEIQDVHGLVSDALLRQVYGDARVDTETTVNDTRRVFKDQTSLIRTTKYVGID